MRIGIFGGSFNPVHEGHIRLAKEALSELNLDKVYFVLSHQNPLKKKETLLPEALRIKLLKSALRNHPDFSISLCEVQRKGPSFTVDTLKFFKKKFGSDTVLYFLCGADILNDLERWRSVDEIFKLCRFVVMTRPGYKLKQTKRPILHLPFEALDISSSGVRDKLKRRQDIEKLVPQGTYTLLKRQFSKTKGGSTFNRIRKSI